MTSQIKFHRWSSSCSLLFRGRKAYCWEQKEILSLAPFIFSVTGLQIPISTALHL